METFPRRLVHTQCPSQGTDRERNENSRTEEKCREEERREKKRAEVEEKRREREENETRPEGPVPADES